MKHTKILFEHENALEGGYGIESAWALPVEDDNFQLDNILFYAPEYALGDIVKVENRAGELYVIGLVKASGHSTIRILLNDIKDVSAVRKELKNLGCDSEVADVPMLISVDIPTSIKYFTIRDYLNKGEEASRWTYEEACLAHIE